MGVATAKAVAWAADLPIIAIDHLEAHIYAANLSHDVEYPFVTLLASGGHTALYLSESPTSHRLLGSTVDDAAGEAFDKVSAILGLGYPGGPAVQKAAERGRAGAVALPRPMLSEESLDFSFSGLKTAVLYRVRGPERVGQARAHCRPKRPRTSRRASRRRWSTCSRQSFFARPSARASPAWRCRAAWRPTGLCRERVASEGSARGYAVYIPPVSLCTDNAATAAGLGYHKIRSGDASQLDFDAYARRSPA